MEQEELREQLCTVEESIRFLVLIVVGVLLSFQATMIQRSAILTELRGGEGDTSSVYPLRHMANSLIVGALGFFLCLAIKTWREQDGEDCGEARTANAGLWAALLVFAAAVIRYEDLERRGIGE